MADIVTLPFDKLPDPESTRRAAEWEQTFKRPATTNFRNQHWENRATIEHAEAQQRNAEMALEQKAITDSTAQNYLFRARELPMKLQEHEVAMQERLMDLKHKEALHPLKLKSEQASINAARSLELDRVEDNQFRADQASQEVEGNRGFRAMIAASGAKRGTPQYAEAVAAAREANPNMSHPYFNDVWSSTGSKLDGDTALETFRKAKSAADPGTAVSVTQGGVTLREEKDTSIPSLEKERALRARQLDRSKAMRAKATDADVISMLDEDITEYSKTLSDTESQLRSARGTTSQAAAPPSATAPVSDAQSAAKAWIAANPNDPRAAAIKAKLGIVK